LNMIENKIINTNFQKISLAKGKSVINFREFLKNECELLESYNLGFANFLAGRHYSVLENRKKAFEQFSLYRKYNPPIDTLLMSLGLSTYFDIDNMNQRIPEINEPYFIDVKPKNIINTPVIVSVDIN